MTTLNVDGRALDLTRFPRRERETLQAWDAADLYLLREETAPSGRLLIVNDAFGALAVARADAAPASWGDSWLGMQALRHNLAANGLDPDTVSFVPGDEEPGGVFSLILAKIPKSMARWRDQLLRLRPCLEPGSRVVAGGMIKHIPMRAWRLLEECIGPTRTSQGWRKARLAVAEFDPGRELQRREPDTVYELEGFDATLHTRPGVHAGNHLDVGTRLLLQHLREAGDPLAVADLGCGNGALTLAAARTWERASVLAVDESWQAVASCRRNVAAAGLADRDIECQVGDGLAGIADGSLDLVLCNPPFHQDRTVGEHIASHLFGQVRRALRPDGQLLVVGNRHLDYPARLDRLFGNCRQVADDRKFRILCSRRK